jgi:hypothetical protein
MSAAELPPAVHDHDRTPEEKRNDCDPERPQSVERAPPEVRAEQVVFQKKQPEKAHDDEVDTLDGIPAGFEERLNGAGKERGHAASPPWEAVTQRLALRSVLVLSIPLDGVRRTILHIPRA